MHALTCAHARTRTNDPHTCMNIHTRSHVYIRLNTQKCWVVVNEVPATSCNTQIQRLLFLSNRGRRIHMQTHVSIHTQYTHFLFTTYKYKFIMLSSGPTSNLVTQMKSAKVLLSVGTARQTEGSSEETKSKISIYVNCETLMWKNL